MAEMARLYGRLSPRRHAILLRRRLLQRSLRRRGWYDAEARSEADAIFVGGCGRSGTTLFRELLNRHPRIFCGPETSMFGLPFDPRNIAPYWEMDEASLVRRMRESGNLIGFADGFYAAALAEHGKSRWADKTPNNVRALPNLLTWFPKGRFIHLIRDGRDVACSLRRHPRERIVRGKVVPTGIVNPIRQCAQRWLRDTSLGVALRDHPRCLEVRYESLVADPEGTMRAVCAFLGEGFDPAVLSPGGGGSMREGRFVNNRNASGAIESSSVGRWRRDLTPEERRAVETVAGPLLLALGYTRGPSWVSEDGEGAAAAPRPQEVGGG